MRPSLSFCMPTRNRADLIPTSLASILAQTTRDDEIVIVDGRSRDDTEGVVASIREASGDDGARVRFIVSEDNRGVDADIAHAIELATGDIVWLMSDDDALAPGAVDAMLTAFDASETEAGARGALRSPCIALCDRLLCDVELNPRRRQRWLADDDARVAILSSQAERTARAVSPVTAESFDLSSSSDLARYVARARSIGALFSFISTVAFHRSLWSKEKAAEAYGSCFAVARVLLDAAFAGAPIRYLPEPLVLARGDNDSFAAKGQVARFLVDIDGYLAVTRLAARGDVHKLRALRSVMRREHPWYMLLGPRSRASDDEWRAIEAKLHDYDYDATALLVVRLLGSQLWLVDALRAVRRVAGLR